MLRIDRSVLVLLLASCTVQYSLVEVPDKVYEVASPDTAAPEPEVPADPGVDPDPTFDDPAPPQVEDPDPPPAGDCDHTSDQIYLIGRDDKALYLFDPSTLDLDRLGVLRCGTGASPGSMAVARDGRAFVRYDDETIKEVDLDTLSCSSTSYSNHRTAFGAFGMGFATDVAGGWRESLYVANFFDVAALDTGSWRLDRLGPVPSQPELTGTSAGELWAFLPLERPAQLSRVDKTTGARSQTMRLTAFPNPADIDAFAFAAWGGSFWLFVREYGVGRSTDIYRVDPGAVMTRVATNIGVDIVGAGVSTCAPTQ